MPFKSQWCILFVGAAVSVLTGRSDGPPTQIRLPETQPVAPAPAPTVVTTLPADTLYPVECDVPCLLLASPPGLVGIVEKAGPVEVWGKFAGGAGRPEWKTFKAKQVFFVSGVAPADSVVELLIVPLGERTKESDVVRRILAVKSGTAPQPPPDPKPDPKVDPKPPTPALPDAPDGVTRVLVVFDPNQLSNTPEKRKAILYGGASHDYLNRVTPMGPDGKTREWRVYPKDAKFTTPGTPWEKLLKSRTTDWRVVVTKGGKVIINEELPADADGLITLLKPQLGG